MSDFNNAQIDVALVFPPLVDTNFGNYFPSMALLSGYLKLQKIGVAQVDLNEEFALYMLAPERLESIGLGAPVHGAASIPLDSMPAVAARLLSQNRELLFDERGRHQFRSDTAGPGYLLSLAAHPYRIDMLVSELVSGSFSDLPISQFYRNFYRDVGFVSTLPDSVSVVGLSVPMGPQLAPAILLAEAIAAERPDVLIVMGGPTFSLMHINDLESLLLKFRAIGAVVRFDGEIPLAELVRQSRLGSLHPENVAGVSCVIDDSVFHNPPRPGPRLDDLPFAEYDTVLMGRLADPEIGVIQARGCYWGRCSYCDFVRLYDGSPSYRTRTVNRFVDELEHQIAIHGDREISIITESIPAVFARKLSEELLRRSIQVRWSSFAMVDKRFTAEVFEIMSRAGCSYLHVGMETMNDRALELVQKAANSRDNVRFLRDAHVNRIRLRINLIPNLPSTTYAEALAVLDYFREHRHLLHSLAIFPFEPTRSSAIGHDPERFGLTKLHPEIIQAGQAQFASNHLASHDPAMSVEELTAILHAYQIFADEVNSPINHTRNIEHLQEYASDTHAFRLDTKRADWVLTNGNIHYYHWATRERLSLSQDWGSVLCYKGDEKFTVDDLRSISGDEESAQRIMQYMMRHRMVMPVD